MNKLTKILFARPIARDAIARASDEAAPVRRRTRPTLIAVWTPDPETGRLVCSWRRPADDDRVGAQEDTGEPPPVQMAA